MSRSSFTSSPVFFAGLFSLLSLLSYSFVLKINESIEYIWLLLYIFLGLFLISNCLSLKQKLIGVVFLLVAGFSAYRVFTIPLFYLWLIKNRPSEFKYEHLFSMALFCFPALFLLVNLLGYYFGFPVTLFIWFFGLPLLFLSLIISALPKNTAIITLIVCNFSLIFYSSLAEKKISTFYNLRPKHAHSVLDRNSLLGIAQKIEFITCNDLDKIDDKNPVVTAILPEVPDLLQNFKFPVECGTYYFFGEHDNLRGFIKGYVGKEFNSDRYQRKGPWEIYHPIINYAFFPNFKRSPLYCSNLGCTLRNSIKGMPLIWDYTDWGFPIILAKFVRHKNLGIYLIGDSDPIVGFLAPYNRYFLYDIYNTSSWKWISLFLPVFVIGGCFYIKNNYSCIVATLVLIVSANLFCPKFTPVANVNFVTDGKWLSPHYNHYFSSLPKKIATQGYTVSISKKCKKESYNIVIANKDIDLHSCNCSSTTNLVLGMPNAKIHLSNGQTITPQDIPLGSAKVSFVGKSAVVKDIRNLAINNQSEIKSPFCLDKTCVVGTGSPASIKILDLSNEK